MLVVIAQPEELKLVKELGYEKKPIIITGVGAINVINALKDLPKDTPIINIGYAGSNRIPVGTVVYVGEVHTYHEKAEFNDNLFLIKVPEYESFTCYTSTDFVTKTRIKEPCVFDMELAYIRAMFENTMSIKVVSDNLNKKQYEESVK